MEQSKYQNLYFIEQGLFNEEEVAHTHCNCLHCINNTRPKNRQKAQRIISKKQHTMTDCQAYEFIVKKLAAFDFQGKVIVPDTYFVQESAIIYVSRTNGKIKMKGDQTNIDVKKHFQQQRKRVQGSFAQQFIIGSIFNSSLQESIFSNVPTNIKLCKQIALLTYTDNTQSILEDTLFSKYMQKRKNDPFWQNISHILLIPPQVKHPFSKYTYHYQRTIQSIAPLNNIMTKIAENIDHAQQKNMISSKIEPRLNFLKVDEQQQYLQMVNPESKLMKTSSLKLNHKTVSNVANKRFFSKRQNSMTSLLDQTSKQQLQVAALQVVAFIQLTAHIRILNAVFQFFIEKSHIFVSNIKNCIYQHLQGLQLTTIHDRYKSLQDIGQDNLILTKQQFDKDEQKELWKICSAVVNECLQLRKIELKLIQYKKPDQKTLIQIFLKIFPDFKASQVFSNLNWKNQLTVFVGNWRKAINKIIRQDEGIRILRRFNINFKRTF